MENNFNKQNWQEFKTLFIEIFGHSEIKAMIKFVDDNDGNLFKAIELLKVLVAQK